jgi:SAM-dependent methyltransferase
MAEEFGARSVLDIGCGTGVFALLLAERGNAVTGIDPARASVDVARGKPGADRVRWLDGDAGDLPPMQIDLAVMTGNVAQAIADPQAWRTTLPGAYEALRPGGRLVFETRDPAQRVWEEWAGWTRETTYRMTDIPGVGHVESWAELTDVSLPLVSFRGTHGFATNGYVLTSESTLRFRELPVRTVGVGEFGERDRALRCPGAGHQVVATGRDRGLQCVFADLQVSDPGLHFGQFVHHVGLQACLDPGAVMMAAGVQQVGNLVQRESEALRGLDHPQHPYRLRWIQPVPTVGPVGLGQQSAALVIPQRLQVHPRRGRDLPAAQSRCHDGIPAAARVANASSTAVCPAGTVTSSASSPPVAITAKVKNEQHAVSRIIKSAAHVAVSAVGSNTSRSRSELVRSTDRTACAKNSSNSATRAGCSTVGNVHDSGTHEPTSIALISLR